ncbi:type IV pilin [Halorubrum pallidum]|uniref:Type IV pilin n=1 Tax=Halorubrum pallidum TaxID=1526114 RepID=A0ABD5SZM5_9EURY
MNDRAVTESIGVILLVAVLVVISVTIGSAALVQTNAVRDQGDATRINVKAEVTDSSVTLRHVGGPSLDTEDVLFRLSGDGGRVGPYTLAQIDNDEANGTYLDISDGSDTFDVGDEVTLNHSFTGYIDISLFDSESGDLVGGGELVYGPDGVDAEPSDEDDDGRVP